MAFINRDDSRSDCAPAQSDLNLPCLYLQTVNPEAHLFHTLSAVISAGPKCMSKI